MHAKLAPFFDADSLRTALYPQGECPHDGPTPVEIDDTRAIAAQINALFANPQDDPIQPDTTRAQARNPNPGLPPTYYNQPNAWHNQARRQNHLAAPTYTPPIMAVPTL